MKTTQRRLPKKTPGSKVSFTMQSVRMAKADNRSMKANAKKQGVSFNNWAVKVLLAALAKDQKRLAKQKESNHAEVLRQD